MPSAEILTWVLSGCFVILSALFGVVWNLLRAEAKEHSRLLEMKANNDRLTDLDHRMEKEMDSMRDSNEKLIEKLQMQHDKDLNGVTAGFREQINSLRDQMKTVEINIIRQMEFMFNAHNKDK